MDLCYIDPADEKRPPRARYPRSNWAIRIVGNGEDKSQYHIVRDRDGEFRTRAEARKAKRDRCGWKTNMNSWARQCDTGYF